MHTTKAQIAEAGIATNFTDAYTGGYFFHTKEQRRDAYTGLLTKVDGMVSVVADANGNHTITVSAIGYGRVPAMKPVATITDVATADVATTIAANI